MDKKEFEEVITPKVNRGIGGGVSPEMWEEIELLYMNTSYTKKEVADLFWNHTGGFSISVRLVKEYIEAQENFKKATDALNAKVISIRKALTELNN